MTQASDGVAGAGNGEGATLFEVSWEVCNQVGGIYQVLRSKAQPMVARWGDRYVCVGPYEGAKANLEFEAAHPKGWLGRVVEELGSQGLKVHCGRWLIPGRPWTLLIEHWQGSDRLARAKYLLWADHGISLPAQDWMIDGVVSFADAVQRVLESASGQAGAGRIVAHFHEWLGGLAIPAIRKRNLGIATVFTTHATLLGRYIASSREDFYERLA